MSKEVQQTFKAQWLSADASHRQARQISNRRGEPLSARALFRRSNGYVTNLLAQLGDYANVGKNLVSVVDADSFWVDGYFEETNLEGIREGDPASIKLMGFNGSFAGTSTASRAASTSRTRNRIAQGLATVDPIFTWGAASATSAGAHPYRSGAGRVVLAAGMTATVQIEPRERYGGS